MPQIIKQIGGPGCGKTSHLISMVAEDCRTMFPHDIGVVSLTNAAIRTVKFRLSKTVDCEFEKVGTIHAICYRLLNHPTPADHRLKEFPGYNPALHSAMNIQRNRMQTLSGNISAYYDRFSDWMSENGYTDYTGMLETVLRDRLPLDVRHLYCDESQDHTQLAHAVINMWAETSEKLIMCGDGDQALYRFSGAIPETFIDMPYDLMGYRRQSYRLPPVILDHCMSIIRKCDHRDDNQFDPVTPELVERQKEWRPERLDWSEGRIIRGVDIPDLSLPGTHMIIARTDSPAYPLCEKWRKWLESQKVVYHNPYRHKETKWNPTNYKAWKAVSAYIRLLSGSEVSLSALGEMAECLIAKETMERGAKKRFKEWVKDSAPGETADQFSLVSHGFLDSFIFAEKPDFIRYMKLKQTPELLDRLMSGSDYYKICEKPKVIIGTIHSVKGGEADHVWIDSGTSANLHKEFENNVGYARDDETRIMYVAASRARHTVGYLNPTSGYRNQVLA